MQPTIAVSALIEDKDHILLVERLNPPAQGYWAFPGGRVQAGETLAAALKREVAEETGLDIGVGDLIGHAESISDHYHYIILTFWATVTDGELISDDDAKSVRWVRLVDLGEIRLTRTCWQMLKRAGIDISLLLPFSFRPATIDDRDAIKALLEDAFTEHCQRLTYTPGALCERIETLEGDLKAGHVYLGTLHKEPVSTVRLIPDKDGYGYLARLGVASRYKGLGIGRLTMQYLEFEAVRQGLKEIKLKTSRQMLGNEQFYLACGYKLYQEENNEQQHIFLCKEL